MHGVSMELTLNADTRSNLEFPLRGWGMSESVIQRWGRELDIRIT
jgi:hypothetical protein